jgi:hypothetical protein
MHMIIAYVQREKNKVTIQPNYFHQIKNSS